MILSLYHEYRPDATKNKDAWKNMRLYLSKFDRNVHHLHNYNGFVGFKIYCLRAITYSSSSRKYGQR